MINLIIILFLFLSSNILSQIQFRMAPQIKYSESKKYLDKLENNELEFDFFGLNRGSTDCIYFVYENEKYFIDFEVMVEEQKAIAVKFFDACEKLGYSVIKLTYGNEPYYNSDATAPVYRIFVGKSKEKVYEVGLQIIKLVFNANENTIFEVVP
jgi:hypothetical protein